MALQKRKERSESNRMGFRAARSRVLSALCISTFGLVVAWTKELCFAMPSPALAGKANACTLTLRACMSRYRLVMRATSSELQGLTVTKLKELLKARDLPVSGKKDLLVQRLLEADDDDEESMPAPAPAPKAKSTAGQSGAKSASKAAPQPAKDEKVVGKSSPVAKKVTASTPVLSGDTVFFLTRTGKYIDVEQHRDDLRARGVEKGQREAFILKKDGGGTTINSGDVINLQCWMGQWLDFMGNLVRARHKDRNTAGQSGKIRIKNQAGSGPIRTGDVVFLHGHQGKVLDVEKEDVKCRWPDEGDWQVLRIEK